VTGFGGSNSALLGIARIWDLRKLALSFIARLGVFANQAHSLQTANTY